MLKRSQSVAGAILVAGGMLAVTTNGDAKLLEASVLTGNVAIIDIQISGTAFKELVGPRSSARATAQYGLLRAIGQAAEVGSFPPVSALGSGVATWQDDVTINAPGMTGQSGSMTVRYQIDGSLSFTSTASAEAHYAFQVNKGAVIESAFSGNYQIGVGSSGSNFLNQEISSTFGIKFGEERRWTFSVQGVGTVLGIANDAAAVANLEDTGRWLGIAEVRDAAGNSVSDFSVASASGTDWARAVPKPSMLMAGLLGAGLLLLARGRVRVSS